MGGDGVESQRLCKYREKVLVLEKNLDRSGHLMRRL